MGDISACSVASAQMQAAKECIPFQGPPPDNRQKSVGMTLVPDPVSSVLQCARSSVCPQMPASITPVMTSHFLLSVVPLGSEVRSQCPAADYANLPFRYIVFLLSMKAERKRCFMFYGLTLRWDTLHFCFLWCLMSHPSDT